MTIFDDLQKRLIDLVGGKTLAEERHQNHQALAKLADAYLATPFERSPVDLLESLKTLKESDMYDVFLQLQWEMLPGYALGDAEAERKTAVSESQRMWRYDVITQFVVWLWTNYAYGERISITVNGARRVEKAWEKFLADPDNVPVLGQDRLQRLSETVLVDGEVFFVYFISTLDGEVTVRTIPATQMVGKVTDPADDQTVVYWKRSWTQDITQKEMYYLDYSALLNQRSVDLPAGSLRAEDMNPATVVCVQQAPWNVKTSSERGWPLMTAAAPWSRAHKRFREDRASVAAAVAMYIQKIKVKGGSRAVDSVRSKLASAFTRPTGSAVDTNPPAAAGSTFLENEAATLDRLPMNTGAGDAKTDGSALLLMAAIGGGVYPHWLGDGDSYRLATATAMEGPMLRQFSRYQNFWSAQFRHMVEIVIWAAEEYNGLRPGQYTVEISTDRLLQVDLQAIASATSQLFTASISPMVATGAITVPEARKIVEEVWRQVAFAIGIQDPIFTAEVEVVKPTDE